MAVRALTTVLVSALLFTSCGDHRPDYGSTRALAAAFGCNEVTSPTHVRISSKEICEYDGHRVAIRWLGKDGRSEGFLAASRGNGFVLGSGWLVKCWHGADCQRIQRKVGGKAYISTGPIL